MTVKVYIFGEAHIEYFDFINKFTNDKKIAQFVSNISQLSNALSQSELVKFLSNIEKYKKIAKEMVKKIKDFYKIIEKLASKSVNNVLFLEGNFPEKDDFKEFLKKRGVKTELFKEFNWLDKKGYHKIKREKDEIREKHFLKVLKDYLKDKKDLNVFCIVGLHHLRNESVFSQESLSKEIKVLVSNYKFKHKINEEDLRIFGILLPLEKKID